MQILSKAYSLSVVLTFPTLTFSGQYTKIIIHFLWVKNEITILFIHKTSKKKKKDIEHNPSKKQHLKAIPWVTGVFTHLQRIGDTRCLVVEGEVYGCLRAYWKRGEINFRGLLDEGKFEIHFLFL